MTLRTGSLRIDPVALALDGEAVVGRQKSRDLRQIIQPLVAGAAPRVAEDHDRRRAPPDEATREFRPERLDAGIGRVVEEVQVVQEARGLADVEAEERVNAAFRYVHDLHRRARDQQGSEVAHEGRDAALLAGYPRRASTRRRPPHAESASKQVQTCQPNTCQRMLSQTETRPTRL